MVGEPKSGAQMMPHFNLFHIFSLLINSLNAIKLIKEHHFAIPDNLLYHFFFLSTIFYILCNHWQ